MTDQYAFHRIKRSLQWEDNRMQELLDMGLYKGNGLFSNLEPIANGTDAVSAMGWLRDRNAELRNLGFELIQEDPNKRIIFCRPEHHLNVEDKNEIEK